MSTAKKADLMVSREYGDTMDPDMLHLANGTRDDSYYRPITEDERNASNEDVVSMSHEIESLEDSKKETMKQFTDQIKEIKGERKERLRRLKEGTVEEFDTIHVFMDHDNAKVHEYNSKGERILVRTMKPAERQTRIPGA